MYSWCAYSIHLCRMSRQLLYLLGVCALLMATSNGSSYQEEVKSWRTGYDKQGNQSEAYSMEARKELLLRNMAGPGSHPPMCTRKCNSCTPCRPVHVPVPPGATDSATEYYPEAWRCKCGDRLYIP